MNIYVTLVVVAVIVGFVVSALANKHARALIRSQRLRIDRYKMRHKHAEVRLEVFGSSQVVDAVKAYAREHRVSVEAAERQARIYLMEIMPKFNLLAYYRLGGPIARALLYLMYWVVVDRDHIERFNRNAKKDTVVVYMINHRSNVDYVLVAHMLFKFISLSYAVGEWARVWPLEQLFKWFGGYFIRRQFREPLYHAVLRQFVATITRSGVTQGVFLEGGLSRDGAFLKPKVGMLDYLVQSKRDPRFTGPLVFMPTAVNYDRVLEDRNLTEELLGREDRRSRLEKLSSTIDYMFFSLLRSLRKRFKRYGYAMVSFGEPVVVDDFIKDHPDVLSTDYETRKPHLEALADLVMQRISEAFPLTPVTLAASIFAARHREGVTEAEMVRAIEDARVRRYPGRVWMAKEQTGEEIWEEAKTVLTLRRQIYHDGRWWHWEKDQELLCDYYANALKPFDEVARRGWPSRRK